MLDARLSAAFSMYRECELGADIGCDHGFLPCELVKKGVCGRMILSDISEKALSHSIQQVEKQGLSEKCLCICADGLQGINEQCGCISIMGMGGETISRILLRDSSRLRGTRLILSPQTDLPMVRQALADISYHIEEERVCLDGGRYYLIFLAEPGERKILPEEIRRGKNQTSADKSVRASYFARQEAIREKQLAGLAKAETRDEKLYTETCLDIAYFKECRRKMQNE